MKLEEAKQKYQGEWIAFRAFDESKNPEGEIVLHNGDGLIFDKELMRLNESHSGGLKRKGGILHIIFTGQIPQAFLF